MEVLLLESEAYVQERFREIEAERRATATRNKHARSQGPPPSAQQKQSQRKLQDVDEDDLASLAGDMCADSQDDDEEALLMKWRALQQRQYRARADALDAKRPANHLERKLVVLRAVLIDLYSDTSIRKKPKVLATNKTQKADTLPTLIESGRGVHTGKCKSLDDVLSPLPFQDLPLATQLGLRIFFQFCQSLQDSTKLAANCRVLLQVAARLPSLLAVLPPFPLSPGFTDMSDASPSVAVQPSSMYDSSGNPKVLSVFQSLFMLLSDLLNLPSTSGTKPLTGASGSSTATTAMISPSERSILLAAYIALCLKWGSLRHLLSVILLLINDSGNHNSHTSLHFEQLESLFAEVAHAMPEVSSNSLQDDAEDACCGYLMSFGKGDHGKLGHGQCSHSSCAEGNCTENKSSPTMLSATRDTQFSKIDSLSTHSVAITTNGQLLAWGNGDKYRLGHGTTTKEYTPKIIESINVKGRVVDISCGLGHTVALLESGSLYAWGNGSNGRLGLGDTTDRSTPTKIPMPNTSELHLNTTSKSTTGTAKSQAFRHVYCGASHSLAISYDGRAFAWGKNNQGQCGHDHTNDQLSIQQVKFFKGEAEDETEEENVLHAAGGWEHTLFSTASGRVYSCGCGYKDSRRTGIPPVLGHGDCERRIKPTVVQFFVDNNDEIAKVACGWDHSLAVSASGLVYSWGSGTNGKLGHGDEENCDVPTLVRAMEGKRVKVAKAGCEHTVLLTDEQQVWSFGQGDSGRLGHGDNLTRKVPTLIESFAQSGLKPVAIAVGDKYNLVLVEDCHDDSDTDSHDRHRHTVRSSKLHLPGAIGSDFHRKQRRLSSIRRELEKKNHLLSSGGGDALHSQSHFGSDWVLAVGGNLQKQMMKESEIKEESGPSKLNMRTAVTLANKNDNNNSLLQVESAGTNKSVGPPDFFPQSRSECVLFLLGHVDRLSTAYFSEDHDNFRTINNDSDGGTDSCLPHLDASSIMMQPFAIDTSRESFVLLLQILRLQCSSSTLSSSSSIKDNTSSPIFTGNGSRILLLQRMCIALSCLRILKANLSKSLHTSGGEDSISAMSSLLKESALQLERACSSSGLETVNTLEQIHSLVNRFASADANEVLEIFRFSSEEKKVQNHGSNELLPRTQTEILNIAKAVSQEAAQVLQVGFVIFYPQPADRRGLLWELTSTGFGSESQASSMKILVLADRICEADVMEELFLHMFAREDSTIDSKHVCVDCSTSTIDRKNVHASLSVCEGSDHNEAKRVVNLMSLMISLVQRCAIEACDRLEASNSHPSSHGLPANNADASLRVLSVLQLYLFGIATSFVKSRRAQPREADQRGPDETTTSAICPCVMDSLLLYLDALFAESMVVLKKLHKESCQHEGVVTWRLNGSFFHNLLPTAIQALCILLPLSTNSSAKFTNQGNLLQLNSASLALRFAHRLLPLMHPMLKLLDEVNWKMRHHAETTSTPNNQTRHERCDDDASSSECKCSEDSNHEKADSWVLELQDGCAILCGKLACVAVSVYSPYREEEVDGGELKASAVSSALLPFPYAANERLEPVESKIAPEIAEMLQWEQNGVFEVENELERSGDADSGSRKFDTSCGQTQANAEQFTQSPSYLKEPIKSSLGYLQEEKIAFAKSVGAALFRIGLCFFHDLLRKLTISSTKGFLLSELILAMRPPMDTGTRNMRNTLQYGKSSSLSVAASKSIENLFVRLAKLIAADESSSFLKQKALLVWAIPFKEFGLSIDIAAGVIAKAGITNVIVDLLVDEVGILETSAAFNTGSRHSEDLSLPDQQGFDKLSIQHRSSANSSPVSRSSRQLKPVTALLFSQTPVQSLGSIAWVVLCAVALQLNKSSSSLQDKSVNQLLAPAVSLAASSSSSILQRPMSGNKDYAPPRTAMSPRKRLTLPKRMVVSTVGDSVDQVYELLFTMLTKVKLELEVHTSDAERLSKLLLLTKPSTNSTRIREYSQALLFGNPVPVSSSSRRSYAKHTPAAMVKKPRGETSSSESVTAFSGFTLCTWIHIEKTGATARATQLPKPPPSNTRSCSFPSEPPVLFALRSSKREKMAGENDNSDAFVLPTSAMLTDNELVVCAYRVDTRRVALAIGLKQAKEATANRSIAGENADNQADARQSSWETVLLEDDVQVGQWIHLAIVYNEAQDTLAVFLDGKPTSIKEPPSTHAFAASTIFNKLASSSLKLSVGGDLSEQERSVLLEHTQIDLRQSAQPSGEPKTSKKSHFVGVVDDLLVLEAPLLGTEITWIAQRGPILFQLKRQCIAESHCTDILQLLCRLMHHKHLDFNRTEQPIIAKETPAALVETTTPSARWVTLFVQLLDSFPSGGLEARVLLCELLQRTLPEIAPSARTGVSLIGVCKSLFRNFDVDQQQQTEGNPSRVLSVRDIFLEQNGLHKSSTMMHSYEMNVVAKQNETLKMLMHDNRIGFGDLWARDSDCGSESGVLGDQQKGSGQSVMNRPSPKPDLSSLEFSSSVRLVQHLWKSSAWHKEIRGLLEEAASGFLQPTGVPEAHVTLRLKDNPAFWELVAVASALGGYSELAVNQTKALSLTVSPSLALSVLSKMELPFSSAMSLQDASWNCTSSLPLNLLVSNLICAALGSDFQLPAREPQISYSVTQSEDTGAVRELHDVDRYVMMMVHLRTSVLRFVATASRNNSESLWTHLGSFNNEQQQSSTIEQLFQLASTPALEFIDSTLGSDHKKALKLRSIRTLIQELLKMDKRKRDEKTTSKPLSCNPFPSLPQVESLAYETWENSYSERQRGYDKRFGSYWWQEKQHSSHSQHSLLEILGGEVEIHNTTAKALEHFPTVRLGGNVAIAANSGLWFYEVVVLSDGLMQIGYIDESNFASDPIQGQGVGDHANSWGFDGFRCKKWNVNSSDYGEPWRAEDVVGVLLDTDRMELSFFLNGKFLGVAFSGIPMTQSSRMCPAASLNVNQAAQFNFGLTSTQQQHDVVEDQVQAQGFAYVPVLDSEQDQSRLQSVALAVNDTSKTVKSSLDLISDEEEVSGLDEGGGYQSDNNDKNGAAPSSGDEDEDGSGGMDTSRSSSFGVRLPNATYFSEDNTARDSRSRENAADSGTSESIEDTLAARRNDLIDGLTGLGFPREWAIRCAIETNLSINESGAVSWILEKMEKDATAATTSGAGGLEASSGHGRPITESSRAAGRGVIHASDLLNSRSADDLSLLTSTSSTALSGLALLNARHFASLSSGTTGLRPHTEHVSRNRAELFSEPQNPTLKILTSSSIGSTALQYAKRRGSSTNAANPYLAVEQEDVDFEDELLSNELFVAREYNGNGFEQLLMSTRTDILQPQPNSKKAPTGPVQDRLGHHHQHSHNLDGDEMVPLCLTLDSLLTVLHARHALFNLLTCGNSAPHTQQQVLGLVSSWCSRPDSFSRLVRFLKATLGLEKHEPVAEAQYLSGASDVKWKSEMLQRTFRGLLALERQQHCKIRAITDDCEEDQIPSDQVQQLPVFHALFNELRDQCSYPLSLQKHERGGTAKKNQSAIGQSAAWVLWLSGVVFASIESQLQSTSLLQSQDGDAAGNEEEGRRRVVATSCYSLSFFHTLVTLASGSSFAMMPWKLVAFTLMKRILVGIAAESQVRASFHSDSSSWASDPLKSFESAAQMHNLLDLFALRYRKENTGRVFFSSLTQTIFKLLMHHWKAVNPSSCATSDGYQQPEVSRENNSVGLDFCIEAFSSNYATVFWGQSSNFRDQVSETSEVGVENTALSLSVSRQADPFHEELLNENLSDHAPRTLPSKGTYTIRNLLPDTKYILRLSPVPTMVSINSSSQIALGPFDYTSETLSDSPPPLAPAEPSCPGSYIRELRFQTPPEPLFQLEAASMGKNLTLLNRNLSVKNLINKKWHTVRASVGFDEGVHQWHVRIDTCVSKNIFIGVCTLQASLENYIGSDGFGYGFLANKAVWHNKSKLHSYGEIFKQGDLLQVTLDCNAKTLAFSRNGEYLGIAATNLHTATSTTSSNLGLLTSSASEPCKWYPAFSMYNKDDQLTIIPPSSATMFAKSARSQQQQQQNASMLDLIEAMQTVGLYQRMISSQASKPVAQAGASQRQLYAPAFADFHRWRRGEILFREVELGKFIRIDASQSATHKFGFSKGDSVFTSRGQATVLGEFNHELWYECDTENVSGGGSSNFNGELGLGSWSLYVCKQMLSSPSEFPVHRHARSHHCHHLQYEHSPSRDSFEGHESHESDAGDEMNITVERFEDFQEKWNRIMPSHATLDAKLMEILDEVAASRAMGGPQSLSFVDISAAFVLKDVTNPLTELLADAANKEQGSQKLSTPQIMARIGLLLFANRNLYKVVRLVLAEPTPRSTLFPISSGQQGSLGRKQPLDKRDQEGKDGEEDASGDNKLVSSESTRKKNAYANTVATTDSIAALMNSPQWSGSNPSSGFRNVDHLAAKLLFRAQKARLISESLKKTTTPTNNSLVNTDLSNHSSSSNSMDDDSYDPSELPRIRVRYPAKEDACVPFWSKQCLDSRESGNKSVFLVPEESNRRYSLFMQVSQQLQSMQSRELRRAYATPFEPLSITRTFHVVVEVAASESQGDAGSDKTAKNASTFESLDLEHKTIGDEEEGKPDASSMHQAVLDIGSAAARQQSQATQYVKLLEEVMRELQSPVFPLFVPVPSTTGRYKEDEERDDEVLLHSPFKHSSHEVENQVDDSAKLTREILRSTTQLELDLNTALFSPSVAVHYQLTSEQLLLWYFQFGQLLGVAWRGGVLLPLQFISSAFWENLVGGHHQPETNELEDNFPSASNSSDFLPGVHLKETVRTIVLQAIRDGLFSIVPSRCVVSLLTPAQVRSRLLDPDMFAAQQLKSHAFYDADACHHTMFWDIVGAFTAVERRTLLGFLLVTGISNSRAVVKDEPFVLEISSETLVDSQQSHPDACYPVVVAITKHKSRLHLPAYSSMDAMRKKLLLAMTTHCSPWSSSSSLSV